MAGLGAGWGIYGGKFQNAPQISISKPQQAQPAIDAGPSAPPPTPKSRPSMGGGINTGRGSLMGILPSVGDPFRTYGTVEGGRVVPPQNPYGPPSNLPTGGGAGTWEGGGPGPINTAPPFVPPTGGFTGGQMPPGMSSETSGARTGYYNPQTQIPNMNQGGTGNIGQRGDQRFQNRSMLRNAYAGAGPSLSSRPFRSQMYY